MCCICFSEGREQLLSFLIPVNQRRGRKMKFKTGPYSEKLSLQMVCGSNIIVNMQKVPIAAASLGVSIDIIRRGRSLIVDAPLEGQHQAVQHAVHQCMFPAHVVKHVWDEMQIRRFCKIRQYRS